MVEKIKINDHGDCIYNEQDALDILYNDPEFDISKLFFDSTEKYNNTIKDLGLNYTLLKNVPKRENIKSFDEK